jgi:hypothetical protein
MRTETVASPTTPTHIRALQGRPGAAEAVGVPRSGVRRLGGDGDGDAGGVDVDGDGVAAEVDAGQAE